MKLSSQSQECFQGVQPKLAAPLSTTDPMKPAGGSNDPPLSHPQGFRDTLAHTPGGHFNFISTQQNGHILAETKVEGSL